MLRLGMNIGPNPFEQMVWIEANRLGFETKWWVPVIGKGRAGTYERDIDMVAGADLVLGIFESDAIMEGGTGHVIEKAIDQNVPAVAYSLDGTQLNRVGEHEPEVKLR
jgi:hypothetical protein